MEFTISKKIAEFMGHCHIDIEECSDDKLNAIYDSEKLTCVPWNLGRKGEQIAWNKGMVSPYTLADSTKEKLRLANTGKTLTDEHKAKIGAANSISKMGCTAWNKGKKLTENQKRKCEYIVTRPNGAVETITNMAKYCRDNDLIISKMSNVSTGKLPNHRGYTVQRVK